MALGTWNDPESLIAFFHAKGHHNMVLAVDTLEKLPPRGQEKLCEIVAKLNIRPPDRGHLIIPYERFRELTMVDLESLQEVSAYYRDIRWAAGYPAEKNPDGSVTLVEMDDHERQLAERAV